MKITGDVPDIWFRLVGYPAIFNIRFRLKWYQEPDTR